MGHEDSPVEKHHPQHDIISTDGGHGKVEPAVAKRTSLHESIAQQMTGSGIDCQPIDIGSHPLESKPYSSHIFGLGSRVVTNKGMIKVRGRNFDLVQIIQRT